MARTLYGCRNAETGQVIFAEAACDDGDYLGCDIVSGVHAGQVGVTPYDYACIDTYYGCEDPDTGQVTVIVPDECCGAVYAAVLSGDIYKQSNGKGDFVAMGKNHYDWHGMAALGWDIYAAVHEGYIYKNFSTELAFPHYWEGMTTHGKDIYAAASGSEGGIYKQTNGEGAFGRIYGTGGRNWRGMTTRGNDIYACTVTDIYIMYDADYEVGFVSLDQPNPYPNFWHGMTTKAGNVYASAFGGDIYMQTGGTGDFQALNQTNRWWRDMTTLNANVYADVWGGDIYMQTGGTGNFMPLSQTSREWRGMAVIPTYSVHIIGEDYLVNRIVIGSDYLRYICINEHTATADDAPITGEDWETYWMLIE